MTLKVTLTLLVNCKLNEYSFFIVWFLLSYLPQFLTESLQIFNGGCWKRIFRLHRYYVINIFKFAYLLYCVSDWTQISSSKIRLMICICILTWSVVKYNKITQTLFLQIFGHAAFIKQKVRWHSTIYMISIFHLQRLQR